MKLILEKLHGWVLYFCGLALVFMLPVTIQNPLYFLGAIIFLAIAWFTLITDERIHDFVKAVMITAVIAASIMGFFQYEQQQSDARRMQSIEEDWNAMKDSMTEQEYDQFMNTIEDAMREIRGF